MAVPMMIGEQVIGVFDVQSDVVGRFSESDIAVQTTLAAQIAAAVENARSYTKVREAEQLTRTIIDATTDVIFIKDREHRYILVNAGYANSFHVPASELIGKDDLELGFPEELVRGNPEKGIRGFWTDDNLVFETGKTQHYPNDPVSVDGAIHILDTLKIPLRNADGQIWGVLGFSRDVTEREHLHELTAQRARQQEAINLITQKIQSAITVEEALQVAAREVGHVLGGRETIVALDPPALAVDGNRN
jgi:PAS domain S-box-containing protein